MILLNLLVICASAHASDVAYLARDFFTVRAVRVVVVAVSDATERLSLFRSLAAEGRFQVSCPDDSSSIAQVLDIKLRTSVGILLKGDPNAQHWLQATETTWFNDSYHWLNIEDGEGSPVGGWPLRLDSEFYAARRMSEDSKSPWQLEELLRTGDEPIVSWPFAAWTSREGLSSTDTIHFGGDPLEDRRSQLRRAAHYSHPIVRTAVFEEHYTDAKTMLVIFDLPPEIRLTHLNTLSTITLSIVRNTFLRYNASVIAKDFLKSGELETPPSGVFPGASGAVQRGSIDLVATGLIISSDRLLHFSFAPSTFKLRIVGLFLAEGTLGSVDALITPFTTHTWLALMAVALSGLLLYRYRRFRLVEGNPITWSDSVISSVGTLTGQGFSSTGEWFSGRIVLLVFEIFFMIVQGYYGSAIVTFLLRPPLPSVRNVEDLLHSRYPVALHEWWLIIREFETATSGIGQQLFEKKIGPPHGLRYMSSEALESVLVEPLHVIAGAEEPVYKSTLKLNEGQACRLHEMDVLTSKHIAVLANRLCPFKETLYAGVLLQHERGILQRLSRKWAQPRARCSGDGAHAEGDPIGLDPIMPLVGVLTFGCIEIVCGRKRRNGGYQGSEGQRETTNGSARSLSSSPTL